MNDMNNNIYINTSTNHLQPKLDSNSQPYNSTYINQLNLPQNINNKEEALLLATDPSFNIANREFLYCDNSEILNSDEFFQKCKEEVKKEYSNISNEEIASRTKLIIKNINKKNNEDESDDINESGEGYDSSSFEQEESEDDDIISMEFPFSNENSSDA